MSEATPAPPPSPEAQIAAPEAQGVRVPILLAGAAAWCWRIVVILAAFYPLLVVVRHLKLLLIPFLTALLTTALLMPVASWLRRRGVSRGWSTLITVVLALAVLGSVGFYVTDRAIAGYPALADQTSDVVRQIQSALTGAPFHLNPSSVNNVGTTITNYLHQHQSAIASGVIKAGRTAIDVLTGVVLWLFLTIMLIYDGERVWGWIVALFPRGAEERVRGAGGRAWQTLSGYISGQFLVALFHGVVIGVSLLILRAPLILPLAVLVFVGSFIPVIGALVFGAFAVLVTLVGGGVVKALILLIVLLIENQLEGHVLQPFVVGRYVRLHPIAIAATLTAGALIAGIPGAIFGVPFVASLNAVAKFLAGREDAHGNTIARDPPVRDPGASAGTQAVSDAQIAAETKAGVPARPDTSAP